MAFDLPLRWRYLLRIARTGKLSLRKAANLLSNRLHFLARRERAAAFPSVLIPELTNRCNLRCRDCRDEDGAPVDYLGRGRGPIGLGSMDAGLFEAMVGEGRRRLLAVVLYVSGESLLHRDLLRMVRFAADLRVGTVLSTNGMLLDGEASEALIAAGIDLVKVVVSGATQAVHERLHRGSDLSAVLANVERFVGIRRRLGASTVVAVDFIRFPYNAHEAAEVKGFCRRLGIAFNERAGFTVGASGEGKAVDPGAAPPVRRGSACDWLWTVMTVGWRGDALPCGNYAFTAAPDTLGRLGDGATVADAWNGAGYRRMRAAQLQGGRGVYPMCANCHYGGIDFQY